MSNPELMQQLMMNNPQLNQLMEVDYFKNYYPLYMWYSVSPALCISFIFLIQVSFKTDMSNMWPN